ncbi:NudC domain-containing protein 1 [Fasciola gigantica]|uniref:NudC domain-containing protein 1 n=1 Tax=Fasciola gigantica TaxID=46835 RepID=A0A504YDD0_FASGI|nr:NudC domain-containing protein 1 [Fasciola gigantica]
MNVTLRPDRKLLDANFESYKLSLEKVPIFKTPVRGTVNFVPLTSSLSKQHLKAYSCQNCLTVDPFHSGYVYYITSEGKVFQMNIPDNAMIFNSGFGVCEIPDWKAVQTGSQVFASLRFPSSEAAIIYDGVKSLIIYATTCAAKGKSTEFDAWKPISTLHPPLDSGEAVLLDACSAVDNAESHREIHCLFGSVVQRPEDLPQVEGSKSSFITYLDWLTFRLEKSQYHLFRHRKFAAPSFPDYVAFEKSTGAVHICSDRQFRPMFDSANAEIAKTVMSLPDTTSASSATATESATPVVPILWSQTDVTDEDDSGSVVISFQLVDAYLPASSSASKQSVHITISPRVPSEDEHQSVRVQITHPSTEAENAPDEQNTVFLDHVLYGSVDGDAVWSIDRGDKILEVHLNKKHALHWPRLLHDIVIDQHLVKPKHPVHIASQVETIQDRHMTPKEGGDENTAQGASLKPAFNVEQLEDVDFALDQDEDDLVLQRFDAETLELTHQASLSGHQWLLNVLSDHTKAESLWATNAFCIRHDVDGVVWLPHGVDENDTDGNAHKSKRRTDRGHPPCPWRHICTLQAFGYVLASKRDHRFVSAPPLNPDTPLPFVAVADASKRIYVYRQPLDSSEFPSGDMELRRRKVAKTDQPTPEGVVHVAWQHVVCLPDNDEIIGFVTLSKPYPACVACTQNHLYLISLVG